MTLEEFFVREFGDMRREIKEKEKIIAKLQKENDEAINWLSEFAWLMGKTNPELIHGGSLWLNSCFVQSCDTNRALTLLNEFNLLQGGKNIDE